MRQSSLFERKAGLISFFFKIISQQGDEKELLRVDLSLFNHPEGVAKPLDFFDCDVKVQFAKATIVFLFKHIGALLVQTLFDFRNSC